jgi:PAS fold
MIRCVDFVWRTGLAIVGKHRVRSLRALCESATIFPQILFSGRTQQHSQTHTIERPTRGLDHVQLDEARKSEALLAAAEQLANLGNWRYDVASDKMAWSAQRYRMLGLNPHKTLATRELWPQTVYPEDRERVLEDFNKVIAEGKPIDA